MRQIFQRKAKTNFAIRNRIILKGEVVYITDNYRSRNSPINWIDVYNWNKEFLGTVNSIRQRDNIE